MSRQRSHAGMRPQKAKARPVSRPQDRHEREAERAADIVGRGGSVSNWSFAAVPAQAAAPVQRQEVVKEKSEDEKKKEALKKTGEAALATPEGKALKEKVLEDPGVKKVKDAVTSTPGLIIGGAAAAGGVAALAATGKELPFQPPEIPLDKVTPGLSAQVTYQGPVNAPTFVGLSVTFKEQGPKKGKGAEKVSPYAAETARLRAEQERFQKGVTYAPGSKEAEEQRLTDEAVKKYVFSQSTLPGLTIPLTPPKPKEEKKEEEAKPVQPARASSAKAPPEYADTDDALTAPGRPLEPSTRRSMEARFGYDFSGVRVHDDARAAATASAIDAAAFTVGEDVVFGAGRYDPASLAGRHLLAHELAHIVQQAGRRGGSGPVVQRRSIFEEIGIFFGLIEGEFTTDELLAYLRKITGDRHIEDDYDSDNKARAIVRRYQTGDWRFNLTADQKVLLIREMLTGPTLAEDEGEIVALLEVSDNEDLAVIFGPGGIRVRDLESDIGGSRYDRLEMLFAGRFMGGREALLRGRVEPRGYPRRAFDQAALTALIDAGGSVDEIVARIIDLAPVERERGTRFLARERARLDRRDTEISRELSDETDPAHRTQLQTERRAVDEHRITVDRALRRLYRDVVGGQTAETLRERTVAPEATPQQRERVRRSEAPEVRVTPGTQEPVPFQRQLPGEDKDYETKLREALPGLIQGYYNSMVVGRGPAEHADPHKTHQLAEFERMANEAKRRTDIVFGHLARSPALRADQPGRRGNIHDLFADFEARLQNMRPEARHDLARGWVLYMFASNGEVRTLNDRHNASPSFDRNRPVNEEARILSRLADEATDTEEEVRRINEIQRGWPATAGEGINIQLFKRPTPEADRLFLWDMFQTLIHEYMHTLAHSDYRRHAASFGYNSTRYNTLIEGVDTLLAETVWSDVEPRVGQRELRLAVEGPEYADLDPIHVPGPEIRRYGSYAEAVRLSEVVGIANIYAAYFLGDVSKIGG
jgi:hypothetical protein